MLFRRLAKFVFASVDFLLPKPPGPRVLIYHQVGSETGMQMEVTRRDFEWQIDWLSRNRTVVRLEDAIERWHESDADQLTVITFDDGYEDVYTTAYPLLLERRLPFTLYLTTEPIESGVSLSGTGAKPLTWSMVREMQQSELVTVGSHTHTHADLRSVGEREIEVELATCDALIHKHLGLDPLHFAYPWGYWSSTADTLVRGRYRTAVLGASPRPSSKPSLHLLNRYPVQLSDTGWLFRARLKGGFSMEEVVRRRLRGYSGPL